MGAVPAMPRSPWQTELKLSHVRRQDLGFVVEQLRRAKGIGRCEMSVNTLNKFSTLLVLLWSISGCALVETSKLGSDSYKIYAYGLGDKKAKFMQEAALRCGDRVLKVEELNCGSICVVGKVRCK